MQGDPSQTPSFKEAFEVKSWPMYMSAQRAFFHDLFQSIYRGQEVESTIEQALSTWFDHLWHHVP